MPCLASKLVRKIMNRIIFILSTALLFAALPFTAASAIKKCQDADGYWNYGDIAVSQCQKSKVTTLNKRGFVQSEKNAPKSVEQLQNELEAQELREAQADLKKAEDDERNRILSVYETEADIDRQRDNQIGSVDSNIAVHKAYLKAVAAKIERFKKKGAGFTGGRKERNDAKIAEAQARIKESNTELKKLEKQKISIMHRFDHEKKIYRELTTQAS